ncbi:MAG: phage tail protein [Rhodanobacter sp.]
MKKPATLRAALVAALPQLATDPDNLLVFIDAGSLHASYAPGLSYEYAYTLHLILTDYAGDPDAVMVPLLMWVRINQAELLDNIDQRQSGISFEADILDHDSCDLSIKLALTERVIVKDTGGGVLTITHADEPQPEAQLTASHWQLYLRGHDGDSDQLLAEWDQPAV